MNKIFKAASVIFGCALVVGTVSSFLHQLKVEGKAYSANAAGVSSVAQLKPMPLRELHTKPNENYLYTASWEEADAADKQYGFTFSTNRQKGFLFTQPGSDTQPLYRLRHKPTGFYVTSSSQSELASLTASGRYILEGVIGHLYATQQPNTVELKRYNNGTGWRLGLGSTSPGTGYKFDRSMGYILKDYYEIGAYYFGMYNQEGSENIRAGTRAVHGRDDWWGGVKDFYGKEEGLPKDTRGWSGDFSHLKPEIGYYDNSDPAVLEQHIEQASSRGLSYFNFYYYWSNEKKQPTIDGGLKAFLAASNRQKMKFTISPCFHQYGTNAKLGLKPADFQTAANYMADVAAQPNFLTTQSGRPLIFMCDTRGIDNGNIASANQFVTALKNTIKQKTGKRPFITQHTEYGTAYVKQLQGDGLTCLNHGGPISQKSYQAYLNNLKSYFTTFDGQRPTWRCAMVNFDERPRTDISIPNKADIRYFTDFSSTKFGSALQLTKESMSAAPASELDNYMTLYAWNEWHEGGILEPNVRDGDLYLRQVQQAFNLPALQTATNGESGTRSNSTPSRYEARPQQ